MEIKATTVKEYFEQTPPERQNALKKLRTAIKKNLPKGFKEQIQYHMPSYVVPHSLYPDGYHCAPSLPLPFVSFASQKNFIALYHMGIYANKHLYDWLVAEYPKHCKTKLDMGKSCIRFKKVEDIPFELIGELMTKMSPEEWISLYEENYRKKK